MDAKCIQQIIEAYQAGATTTDLGPKYGVHPITVGRILRQHGVQLRNKSEAAGKGSCNPAWKGGRMITKDGYVQLRVDGRYVLEHRHVMEKSLGRSLAPGEIVHHKNHVRTDNHPLNLKLVTVHTHGREHIVTTWSRNYDCCVVCQKTDSPYASRGRCARCYMYERTSQQRGYVPVYTPGGKRVFSAAHRAHLSDAALRAYGVRR